MTRLVLAVALLALAGGAARAQECSAKEHYDRATAAYGLSRFADAATEFEKAYECKPQAALLWDAAQAHRSAGNRARAIELYRNYARLYGATAENGAEARRLIEQLEAEQKAAAAAPAVPPPATPAPAPPPVVPPEATPAPAATVVVSAPPPAPKPIYKRPWFWGVVVGGAAVVGVAIGVGVAYGGSTKNPTPSLGTWSF